MNSCPYCGSADVWTDAGWLVHVAQCERVERPGRLKSQRPERLTLGTVRTALQFAVGALDREHSAGEARTLRVLLHHLADWQLRDDDYVTIQTDDRVPPEFAQLEGAPLTVEPVESESWFRNVDLDTAVQSFVTMGLVSDTPEARTTVREAIQRILHR